MAKPTFPHFKTFSNLDTVLEKMHEVGYIADEQALAEMKELVQRQHDTLFEVADSKLKIFRGLFGAYELVSYSNDSLAAKELAVQIYDVAAVER